MTKLIVIVGFAVAFGAGLAVGMRRQAVKLPPVALPPSVEPQTPATKESRSRGGPGWLTNELKLTPQQQEQMRQIWSQMVFHGGREHEDKRWKLRRERDEAVKAFIAALPNDSRAAYEKIQKDHNDANAALDKEMRNRFEKAVERTKAILTPEQREKYEEILKRGPGGGGPGWDRRGPGTRDNPRGDTPGSSKSRPYRPQDDATSRPAAEPTPSIP